MSEILRENHNKGSKKNAINTTRSNNSQKSINERKMCSKLSDYKHAHNQSYLVINRKVRMLILHIIV